MQHLLNYSNTIVYVSDKAIETFISYSHILVSRTFFLWYKCLTVYLNVLTLNILLSKIQQLVSF